MFYHNGASKVIFGSAMYKVSRYHFIGRHGCRWVIVETYI